MCPFCATYFVNGMFTFLNKYIFQINYTNHFLGVIVFPLTLVTYY